MLAAQMNLQMKLALADETINIRAEKNFHCDLPKVPNNKRNALVNRLVSSGANRCCISGAAVVTGSLSVPSLAVLACGV